MQAALGVEAAGALVERTLARVAEGLVGRGVARLVVAGGETSGACVQGAGHQQLRIGAQIDPGVPWCPAETGGGRSIRRAQVRQLRRRGLLFDKAFEVLP